MINRYFRGLKIDPKSVVDKPARKGDRNSERFVSNVCVVERIAYRAYVHNEIDWEVRQKEKQIFLVKFL